MVGHRVVAPLVRHKKLDFGGVHTATAPQTHKYTQMRAYIVYMGYDARRIPDGISVALGSFSVLLVVFLTLCI